MFFSRPRQRIIQGKRARLGHKTASVSGAAGDLFSGDAGIAELGNAFGALPRAEPFPFFIPDQRVLEIPRYMFFQFPAQQAPAGPAGMQAREAQRAPPDAAGAAAEVLSPISR